MPPKSKTVYICNECAHESAKWYGKCPNCGEWNTLAEEIREAPAKSSLSKAAALPARDPLSAINLTEISADYEIRHSTGLRELDRVLGGGIVQGSLILLSGDPGIGKSTILLQISDYLGRNQKVLYVSGEESAHQIKLRAARLNVQSQNLFVMAQTDITAICDYVQSAKPDIVMVDSIQTMHYRELSSSPGGVSQVRESTNLLMRLAKSMNIPILIVGHVNKDGAIAGPKVLEHIVDAVLYFEGDRHLSYRIVRAVKNRYGSTNEIGVFEMRDTGLEEVENPSLMLLSGRPKQASGTCVVCLMEGTRPLLAEVQGLVAPTGFGTPRRMATGFDYNRMAMLMAVLEKRGGYFFGNMDAYINVIGGLRIEEPGADLSVAMALVSSLKDIVVPEKTLAFGEIGLAGEVRSVGNCEARIMEGARLGFEKCIVPKYNVKHIAKKLHSSIEIVGVHSIRSAIQAIMTP